MHVPPTQFQRPKNFAAKLKCFYLGGKIWVPKFKLLKNAPENIEQEKFYKKIYNVMWHVKIKSWT